ncbi:membrane protein [Bacteroidia bacterium]|nr:membrane protein [Bacteroidia bacterium]
MISSCNDWLAEPQPAKPGLADYFIAGGGAAAIQAVNAAYVPLQWEYGSTFCPEWWIGDVASDDALKGGQNVSDMAAAYEFDNFKIAENNAILLDWYQLNFYGIARCNLDLEEIPTVAADSLMNENVRNRLMGEVYFLRALYYFRLVKVFGEVPLITHTIKSSADWKQSKESVDNIYKQIFTDLEKANRTLWTVDKLPASDVGRATKGAAQAMLLKTHLYYAQWDNSHYAIAKEWGDSIISSNKYALEPRYADNFSIFNENGVESVFEVQYSEESSSDWGGDFNPHFGSTRGSFTTVLTRSRSGITPLKPDMSGVSEGWGFNKPTHDLFSEFETGDIRREVSILNVPDSLMTNPNEEIYFGNSYLSRKYTLTGENIVKETYIAEITESGDTIRKERDNWCALWDSHVSRSPINIKLIRYADVLLLYAEACNESGDFSTAKNILNELRTIRRAETADPATQLPGFPYGAYSNDANGLRQAIRHERRVELAMESHRFFDLVRWGIAAETMNAYRQRETPEIQTVMNEFIAGKNEYFPLPQKEIDLSGFGQNDKWK